LTAESIMTEIDNGRRTPRHEAANARLHKLEMLQRVWVMRARGCGLRLLVMLPLALRRASILPLPSRIVPIPALHPPHLFPMRVSGVATDLAVTMNSATPDTPSSCLIVVALLVNGASSFGGGVEVIADHVGSRKSVTPTPAVFSALGLLGKGGVDVHAKREAAATSGTPTPPFGTPPLTFGVRVSAAGSRLTPSPPPVLVGNPVPVLLMPTQPRPPSSHEPPPPAIWDDASAEAGKQGIPVATRAVSLAPLLRNDIRGGAPSHEVAASGAWRAIVASAHPAGGIGEPDHVRGESAEQLVARVLAVGPALIRG
jgi:hypothetical protein